MKGVRRIVRHNLPRSKIDLKKLPILTGYLTSREKRDFREVKLEVYKAYMPSNANHNLIEALLSPNNEVDRLLRIIDDNLTCMSSFYLGVSFEALDDLVRAQLCEPSTIVVSPEFKKLCTKSLYKLRYFEADEVLKVLKCLTSLNISQETLIYQATFKMTRELINHFEPHELEVVLEETKIEIPKFSSLIIQKFLNSK